MRSEAERHRPSAVELALAFPPRALEAGRDYVSLGCVRERARWGDAIAATVVGREPYRVTGRLSAPPEHRCTCPARGRPCKHGAALFLAYCDDPASFPDLGAVAAWYAGRPLELGEALAAAFLGEAEPDLASFVRASGGRAGDWSQLPLGELSRAAASDDFPVRARLSPEEERSLFREALARAKGADPGDVPARPRDGARWLADLAVAARLSLWARRLGAGELAGALAYLRPLLADRPPGALEADLALRRDAFDALARLAARLPAPHEASLLRVLRSAFRLLPESEAGYRWASRSAEEAEAARLAELQADSLDAAREARLRRAQAVGAMAAGWREAGRPDLAAATWELHGDLEEADEGRVRAWAALGDWARVRDAARLGLSRSPARMVPWFRRELALALLELGESAAALPLFAANFAEAPTLRAYRDLREAARRAGTWEEVRAEAAERLATAAWPEAGGAWPQAGEARPQAAAVTAKAEHWQAVARVLGEDAPLLALRYLAAAVSAVRREAAALSGARPRDVGRQAALQEVEVALLALGEHLASEGGARRLGAWRAALQAATRA